MRLRGIKNETIASEVHAQVRAKILQKDRVANENKKKRPKEIRKPRKKLVARMLQPDPVWKTLNIKAKEEIILDWSINGGVVMGRILSKSALAAALNIPTVKIDVWIGTAEKFQLETFQKNSSVRDIFYKSVSKLMHHIQTDRARVLQLIDNLDQEIQLIYSRREEVEAREASNPRQELDKLSELRELSRQLKSIWYLKKESMEVLLGATEAENRFLMLFSGQKSSPGKGSSKGLFDLENERSHEENESYVDRAKAMEILSDNQGAILPVQMHRAGGTNRNPNEGFSGFVDPFIPEVNSQ